MRKLNSKKKRYTKTAFYWHKTTYTYVYLLLVFCFLLLCSPILAQILEGQELFWKNFKRSSGICFWEVSSSFCTHQVSPLSLSNLINCWKVLVETFKHTTKCVWQENSQVTYPQVTHHNTLKFLFGMAQTWNIFAIYRNKV